ncbi:MAG: hypothetical protein RR060_05075 [Victivallaceae bacterium]
MISCYLLVAAIIVHQEMSESSELLTDLKERNAKLKTRRISPFAGNTEVFEQDYAKYSQKLHDLQYYFGHPFYNATDAFAKKLGFQEGYPALIKAYNDFKDTKSGANHTPEYIYQEFKNQFINDWNNALEVFVEQAQSSTLETVDMRNADAILGTELGVPRTMAREICLNYLITMQSKAENAFKKDRKKVLGDRDFGFPFSRNLPMPPAKEIPDIINCFEVTTDLVSRLGKSNIRGLEKFERRDIVPEGDGAFKRYRFKITVNSDMDGLRDLFKILDDAYAERRVYVVRSMDIVAVSDEADAIVGSISGSHSSSTSKYTKNSGVSSFKTTSPNKSLEFDPNVPVFERMGYGAPVIGGTPRYKAVLEIDYVVYVTNKTEE